MKKTLITLIICAMLLGGVSPLKVLALGVEDVAKGVNNLGSAAVTNDLNAAKTISNLGSAGVNSGLDAVKSVGGGNTIINNLVDGARAVESVRSSAVNNIIDGAKVVESARSSVFNNVIDGAKTLNDLMYGSKSNTSDGQKTNTNNINDPAGAMQAAQAIASSCGMFSFLSISCIESIFFALLQMIGNYILMGVAAVLWICGALFNLSILTVVVNMKTFLDNIPAVFVIWRILRDVANMFFIFILLAIAIQTILGIGDYKKMLTNVVIVALFINFSFFFTSALIDVSNTMALMFYKGFSNGNCVPSQSDPTGLNKASMDATGGCMAYNIFQSVKLQTIYVPPPTDQSTGSKVVNGIPVVQNTAAALDIGTNTLKFLLSVILGSILMIILAGIFLASGFLILYRFVELVMLLMLSPLAFAAWILPATKKHWNTWWNKLSNQLIFAPAYFLFLWIVMKIIVSDNPDTGASPLSAALNINDGNFISALKGNSSELFGLIANYAIVIMLLGYSLKLAKELGAEGTSIATSISKGFQGFVGRNTVGRAASRIANSQAMQGLVQKSPILGRLAQKPFDSLAQQSWGGKKGGFEQAEKDRIADREKQAKRIGPSPVMIANAKNAKDAAVKNENEEYTAAKATVDAKYRIKESRVSPVKIARREREAAEAQAKEAQLTRDVENNKADVEKYMDIETDPNRSATEQAAATKSREAAEKALKLSEAEKVKAEKVSQRSNKIVGLAKIKQKEIADKKKNEIDTMMTPHRAATQKATNEADRVLGVDDDEAKKRAKTQADQENNRRLSAKVAEIMRDDPSLPQKEADELAEKLVEKVTPEEIKKMEENIKKANPGIGKAGQQKFADAVRYDYKRMLGTTLGAAVNLIANRTTDIAAAAAIEKNVIKGQSKAEQLLAEVTKQAQAATAAATPAPTPAPTAAPKPTTP